MVCGPGCPKAYAETRSQILVVERARELLRKEHHDARPQSRGDALVSPTYAIVGNRDLDFLCCPQADCHVAWAIVGKRVLQGISDEFVDDDSYRQRLVVGQYGVVTCDLERHWARGRERWEELVDDVVEEISHVDEPRILLHRK